ncbi:MAG: hypothetical protein ACJAVI_005924 [Candidatus Azotimanducaceae bacterium]|jgi:hypothetical protein
MSNKIDGAMMERVTLEMALEEAKTYLAEAGRKVEVGD